VVGLRCNTKKLVGLRVSSNKRHSLEFTVTRTFMKIFRTGSPAVVKDYQYFCKFLPVTYQIDLRNARFMQKFAASENICFVAVFQQVP
jgi:hypothetical protein